MSDRGPIFQVIVNPKGVAGSYAFQFLDTARTFAMLQLQARQAAIQDNLDQVLAYDGSKSRSAAEAQEVKSP